MTALRQDIKMIAGDSRILAFGPVKTEAGAYADLLGASAKWWLGKKPTSAGADVFIQKSTALGGGILITTYLDPDNVTQYTVEVVLNANDTIDVPAVSSKYEHWYHELEVTDVSGGVFTVASGAFDMLPGLVEPGQGTNGSAFADTDTLRSATIAQV